jgi:hypothetical protein
MEVASFKKGLKEEISRWKKRVRNFSLLVYLVGSLASSVFDNSFLHRLLGVLTDLESYVWRRLVIL